jgi:hypothetical protein
MLRKEINAKAIRVESYCGSIVVVTEGEEGEKPIFIISMTKTGELIGLTLFESKLADILLHKHEIVPI